MINISSICYEKSDENDSLIFRFQVILGWVAEMRSYLEFSCLFEF